MLGKVGVYFKKVFLWDSATLMGSAQPPSVFTGGGQEASTPHAAPLHIAAPAVIQGEENWWSLSS